MGAAGSSRARCAHTPPLRHFRGGSLSLTLVQIGNGGLMLIVTQYLQLVLGYTPTQAGLSFIPMAIGSLLFNALGATLGQKFGNRLMAAAGLVSIAAAFGWMATLSADAGFVSIAVALFLLGCGGGLAMLALLVMKNPKPSEVTEEPVLAA